MARKQKFQKLAVNAQRHGTSHFDTQYNARDAAQSAIKYARDGWTVEVKDWNTDHLKMTCWPGAKTTCGGKVIGTCEIKPAFKKQIKGL